VSDQLHPTRGDFGHDLVALSPLLGRERLAHGGASEGGEHRGGRIFVELGSAHAPQGSTARPRRRARFEKPQPDLQKLGRPAPEGPLVPDDANLRFADPAEVRPDIVFRAVRPPWVLFELQNAIDEAKGRRWLLAAGILINQPGGWERRARRGQGRGASVGGVDRRALRAA
jgi:hypothetical protein